MCLCRLKVDPQFPFFPKLFRGSVRAFEEKFILKKLVCLKCDYVDTFTLCTLLVYFLITNFSFISNSCVRIVGDGLSVLLGGGGLGGLPCKAACCHQG